MRGLAVSSDMPETLAEPTGKQVAHHGSVDCRDVRVRRDGARPGAAADDSLVRESEGRAADHEQDESESHEYVRATKYRIGSQNARFARVCTLQPLKLALRVRA